MIYTACSALFIIGVLGLAATLLFGGHGLHRGGHGHGHHYRGVSSKQPGAAGKYALLLSFLSPIAIFSVCFGAGAAGLLAIHFRLSPLLILASALAGGTFYYGVIVRATISLLMNFASTPSKALDGAVSKPAEALSHFDSSGKGLVKLTVDDQVVRLLAILEQSDISTASEIQPGEQLTITRIDGKTNSCHVTRI